MLAQSSMGILLVNLEKVFTAELLLTYITGNPANCAGSSGFSRLLVDVDVMHLEHVSFHEILVTQLFVTKVAIVSTCCRL